MFQQVFSYNAIGVLPNLSPNQMFNEILSCGTGIMNTSQLPLNGTLVGFDANV